MLGAVTYTTHTPVSVAMAADGDMQRGSQGQGSDSGPPCNVMRMQSTIKVRVGLVHKMSPMTKSGIHARFSYCNLT